jgi:hypothetical protein
VFLRLTSKLSAKLVRFGLLGVFKNKLLTRLAFGRVFATELPNPQFETPVLNLVSDSTTAAFV